MGTVAVCWVSTASKARIGKVLPPGSFKGHPVSCVNAATLISQSKFVEHPADEALAYALCAERAMPEDQDIQDLISTIRDSQSGKAR